MDENNMLKVVIIKIKYKKRQNKQDTYMSCIMREEEDILFIHASFLYKACRYLLKVCRYPEGLTVLKGGQYS